MLSNSQLADLQRIAKSHLHEQIAALIRDLRDSALADLQSAEDHVRVFRSQGRVAAFSDMLNTFEHLRRIEEIDDAPNGENVVIPQ